MEYGAVLDRVLHRVLEFPRFEEQVRGFVEQHKEFEDEPLLIAIYYDAKRSRAPNDVFLFEMLGNFPGNDAFDDEGLLEVEYGPSVAFPMSKEQLLHIVLANRGELKAHLDQGAANAAELRSAERDGAYEVLYPGEGFEEILDLIRG